MKAALLAVVLFITIDALTGEGCRCAVPYSHPQDKFCSSDYVIRGLVLSGPEVLNITQPGRADSKPWIRNVLAYVVELRAVFRGKNIIMATEGHSNESLAIPSEVSIYTDNNVCASQLKLGIEYLIAGYSDTERLEVYSCNWVQPWGSLTRSQHIAVKRYYGRHCACRSSLCSVLDPLGGVMNFDCGAKHLYCALRRDGVMCRWRSIGRWYRKCVQENTVQAWHFL